MTNWKTNNYDKHIAQHLSKGNKTMKFGQWIEYKMKCLFLEKSYAICGGKTGSTI